MHMASEGKEVPPQEWEHERRLKDKDGHTVTYYLRANNIKVPRCWKDY